MTRDPPARRVSARGALLRGSTVPLHLRWSVWPALTLALASAAGAMAQRPGADEVQVSGGPYRLPPMLLVAHTTEVPVEVVVRDQSGKPLGGLQQGNFLILDNGKAQPVRSFTVERAPVVPTGPAAAPGAPAGGGLGPAPGIAPPAPRYVGLFFDDVNTQVNDLANARLAALRFVHEALQPGDQAAVFTASAIQSLGFTQDHARLEAMIGAVRVHPRASKSLQPCPRITPYEAAQIAVYHDPVALDAVYAEARQCPGQQPPTDEFSGRPMPELGSKDEDLTEVYALTDAAWDQARGIAMDTLTSVGAVVAYLAKQPGRREMILATGGFISPTLGNQKDDIIRAALRADVVINALDAKGLYADSVGRPLDELSNTVGPLPLQTFFYEESSKLPQREAMDAAGEYLAQSTGGLFFHDNNDLTLGFERLGLAPTVSYQLAFDPENLVADGKLHRLKVKLAPPIKGATVQARRGYFAPPPPAEDLGPSLDAAMRGTEVVEGVPASMQAQVTGNLIRVAVRFDAAALPFQSRHGRQMQKLVVIAGLFDLHGQYITGRRGEMDLALKEATWKRYRQQGMSAGLDLQAGPGSYRLRVAVGEGSDGKIATFSQPLEVR